MPPKKKDDKKDKTDPKDEDAAGSPAEEDIDFLLEYREEMGKWDCVQELISEMLDTAYEHGNEGYVQSLVPTFTIDRLVNDALAVVDLAFLPREDRHNEAAEKGDIGDDWRIDQEPEPAPIDRWARGAVPVRSRTDTLPGYSIPQDTRSGSQPRSSRDSIRPGTSKSLASVGGSPVEPPPKKMPTTFTFSKPAAMQRAQTLSTAEAERDARLRAELEARRALEELQRQQVLADEEEVRKLQHFQKDLRGKDYSYDHKGNLLLLNKVDPEKLPQYIIGPAVKLQKTPEELEAEALLDPKNKKKDEKRDKKKKKPIKSAPVEYLREETTTQPTLMESMVVKTGVTLKENGGTKPGPGEKVNPEHMSRKDFLTILASQKETPKDSKSPPSGASAPRISTSSAKMLDTSASDLDWTMDAKVVLPAPPAVRMTPNVNASFDAKILQDASWGRAPPTSGAPFVPPRPPGKVPDKVLQSTLGKLVQTPRDRPFVTATGLKKSVVFGPNSPKKTSHSPTKDTRNGSMSPKKENFGELASQKG